VFGRIGVPSPSPFRPDPYQLEALEALRSGDVLVNAPTGSGKTWIAQEAIRLYLAKGKRSWYASPLKALSNSKHREFAEVFGIENVGILTGDRKERPDAPVVVGTTEILRNQLYDAMTSGQDIPVDLAVLDEAHYLNDPQRGVVWEEILIYLPKRIRLLLLSATIGNSLEISRWLEETRGVGCRVVQSDRRPVPLHFLFLFPDGELSPLASHKGVLPKIRRLLSGQGAPRRATPKVNYRFSWVIEQLRRWDLLPAIFFLKSRVDCDRAVQSITAPSLLRNDDLDFQEDLETLLGQYGFLRNHRQLPYLQRFRVASHHGGQLPQWKLLIEEMMNRGYLDAIFSTSTVAAGVNFPARTVVLVQSDRFDGTRFSDLTATELHQMTGRAGRRGKDRVGFALVLPGVYQNPRLIQRLIDSPPEPIKSQIQMSFSMVLNLLLSHRPKEIKDLLDRSLAAFQERQSSTDLEKQRQQLLSRLGRSLPEGSIFERPDGSPGLPLETASRSGGADKAPSGLHDQGETPATVELFKGQRRVRSTKSNRALLRKLKKLTLRTDQARYRLWSEFNRYLDFLKETGFVDSEDRLTADGRWASCLRVDHPLLIAEAIRRGVFDGAGPPTLAGLIAPFVVDRTREIEIPVERRHDIKELIRRFAYMAEALTPLQRLKRKKGFETLPLQLWPALSLFLWTKGTPWDSLIAATRIEEGDMVMLVSRTADHLRQLFDLATTHPNLALVARRALPLILREPVVVS